MSSEKYIDEFERFKNYLDTIRKEEKRKKEQSSLPFVFLYLLSLHLKSSTEELVGKWKGMMRLFDAGLDKKIMSESERELVATILLLTAEMRGEEST